MYERAHPARVAAFIGLAGLLAAALYGNQFQVTLAAAAFLPALFGSHSPSATRASGGWRSRCSACTGSDWRSRMPCSCADCPWGGRRHRRARGDVPGRHGRLPGREDVRHATARAVSISPNKTVEGLAIGMLFAVLGVWFASRYQDRFPGTHALVLGLGVALAAPVGDLFESFVKREAATARTLGDCSAPTEARWTGSTPSCSPRSSATTSGRPTSGTRVWSHRPPPPPSRRSTPRRVHGAPDGATGGSRSSPSSSSSCSSGS